jgi:putative transcriptional regulator
VHVRGPQWLALPLLALWLAAEGGLATVAGQPPVPSTRALAGRLLVATPDMRDPRFVEGVVYVIRHDATGAMGLVVNRPLQPVALAQLLERFGMGGSPPAPGGVLVHWGGPVEPGKAFVLHTPDYRTEGTLVVRERVAFTGNRKILEAMASRVGPRRALFAVGYAGWAPGQLEEELARGGWLTASVDEEVLFDSDHGTKWRRATALRLLDL